MAAVYIRDKYGNFHHDRNYDSLAHAQSSQSRIRGSNYYSGGLSPAEASRIRNSRYVIDSTGRMVPLNSFAL